MNLSYLSILVLILGCYSSTPEKLTPLDVPLKELLSERTVLKEPIYIGINKQDYLLHLISGVDTIKSYPIALGTNPTDPKLMQGDRCTPEGEFKIRDMYPHKSWSKFIWIDYPNNASRENFRQAKADGLIPQDAKIGGEVGIHGTPYGRSDLIKNRVNWTHGCISVTQDAINEIYDVVTETTIIKIEH